MVVNDNALVVTLLEQLIGMS